MPTFFFASSITITLLHLVLLYFNVQEYKSSKWHFTKFKRSEEDGLLNFTRQGGKQHQSRRKILVLKYSAKGSFLSTYLAFNIQTLVLCYAWCWDLCFLFFKIFSLEKWIYKANLTRKHWLFCTRHHARKRYIIIGTKRHDFLLTYLKAYHENWT